MFLFGFRTTLHTYALINCRWADEVTQQLDSLQGQNMGTPRNPGSTPPRISSGTDVYVSFSSIISSNARLFLCVCLIEFLNLRSLK